MLLVEFSSREDLDDIQHSYTFSLEGTSKVLDGIQAHNINLPMFVDHNRCVELPSVPLKKCVLTVASITRTPARRSFGLAIRP